MARGFRHHPTELAMDELFPGESSKQANLSAELSSLPPLNLTLRKTPSFLNLLKTKLSKHENSASQRAPEKLKASNFPASLLRIGSWQEVSKNESDLVAKCYYSKKKLVWEVLKNGLKSKIEIQWSDISALRATLREDQPGVLEIELDHAPTFYRESKPQPRKHTIWHMTTDLTDGQASLHRRHYLRFPPGVLDRHYEKLLQKDPSLLELSRKGFPSHDSPYFNWAPYEYHLSYSFDPLAHQVNPQINFRMTVPREQCLPHGLIHQPIQTHQRAYDLAIQFDDSTVSPISGPWKSQDNMAMEFSSSSDDGIAGFSFGDTGTTAWEHGMTDFAEDPTFYRMPTATMEMRTVDMGVLPNNFQQNIFHDSLHYSHNMGLKPAGSFQDTCHARPGFTIGSAVQFGSINEQNCPHNFADSSLASQFNDEAITTHPFGNNFMYPSFSHGF